MKSDNDLVKRLVECRTDYDDALMSDRAEPIGCDCGLLREAGEEIERLRERLAGAVTTVRVIADMSAWHRGEEGRTHLAFQVADNADLSTPAHRRDALRLAVQSAVNGAN